jgi:hypothetical protein
MKLLYLLMSATVVIGTNQRQIVIDQNNPQQAQPIMSKSLNGMSMDQIGTSKWLYADMIW